MNAQPEYLVIKTGQLRTIDTQQLSDKEKAELLGLWDEYNTYIQQFCKNLFSFDDFIQHTTGKTYPHKDPLISEYVSGQKNYF